MVEVFFIVFFLSLWLHLLCLVEVVGASVINIVAKSGSHHGKGIEIRVVLPQPACLHVKDEKKIPQNIL